MTVGDDPEGHGRAAGPVPIYEVVPGLGCGWAPFAVFATTGRFTVRAHNWGQPETTLGPNSESGRF